MDDIFDKMAAAAIRGTSSKKALTQDDLEDVLRKAGWDEKLIPTMSAIGMAESALDAQGRAKIDSYNPGVGPGGRPTKEQSIGPWQINMHPDLKRAYDRRKLASDPLYNAQAAREIYSQQGLRAWGAYTDGRYKKFLRKTSNSNAGVSNADPFAALAQSAVSEAPREAPKPLADPFEALASAAITPTNPTGARITPNVSDAPAAQAVPPPSQPELTAPQPSIESLSSPTPTRPIDSGQTGIPLIDTLAQIKALGNDPLHRGQEARAKYGTPAPDGQPSMPQEKWDRTEEQEYNDYLAYATSQKIKPMSREEFTAKVAQSGPGQAQATEYGIGETEPQRQNREEINKVNAENQRAVGDYNRKVQAYNDGQGSSLPMAQRIPRTWQTANKEKTDTELDKTHARYQVDLRNVRGDKAQYALEAIRNRLMKEYGIDAAKASSIAGAFTNEVTEQDPYIIANIPRGDIASVVGRDAMKAQYDRERAEVELEMLPGYLAGVDKQGRPGPQTALSLPGFDQMSQAERNVATDPFSDGTNKDIQVERRRLEAVTPTAKEQEEFNKNADEYVGPGTGSALLAGLTGSMGSTIQALSGVMRFGIGNMSKGYLGGEFIPNWLNALTKQGVMAEHYESAWAKKNPGLANSALRVTGRLAGDTPRYLLLTRLPGGMPVLFAADEYVRSIGRGERATDQIKAVTKGAALGSILLGAGKLATAVESFTGRALNNPVFGDAARGAARAPNAPAFLKDLPPEARSYFNELGGFAALSSTPKQQLAAKLFGEGARIGSIIGGGATSARLEDSGEVIRDENGKVISSPTGRSLEQGIVLALTDLALRGSHVDFSELIGRIFRGSKDGQTLHATVTPDGEVKLLKGAVPDKFVDIDMVFDPASNLYKPKVAQAERANTPATEPAVNSDARAAEISPNRTLKASPQGRPLEQPGPSEAPVPLRTSETEAMRVPQADPAAIQKAQIDTRVRKVSDALLGKDFVTVEEVAKETRLNKTNVEDALLTLYGAGKAEMLPDGRVRLVNESQTAKETSLFERAKNYGQTPETPVPQSPALSVPSQNVPSTKTATPKDKLTEYTIDEAMKGQTARRTGEILTLTGEVNPNGVMLAKNQFGREVRISKSEWERLTAESPATPEVKPQIPSPPAEQRQYTPDDIFVPKNESLTPTPEPKLAKADRTANKHRSLSQFVRGMGGIKWKKDAWKGEIRRISNKETGTTGLINEKGGLDLDEMALRAVEAGYLSERDPDLLLQMLEEDVSGAKKHYTAEYYNDLQGAVEEDYAAEYETAVANIAEMSKNKDVSTLLAQIEQRGNATDEERTKLAEYFPQYGLDPANVGALIDEITDRFPGETDSERALRQARRQSENSETGDTSSKGDAYFDPTEELDDSFDPSQFEDKPDIVAERVARQVDDNADAFYEDKPAPAKESPATRQSLTQTPPQELTPLMTARVRYAMESGKTPSDIAQRYNLTPEQVKNVKPLEPVGEAGQTSHRLIQNFTPSKTALPEDVAAKTAAINDLAGYLNLADVRVARDDKPADIKTAFDAVRLAIAGRFNHDRASQMTPKDWQSFLDSAGTELEIPTIEKINDALNHQAEWNVKARGFVNDTELGRIIDEIDDRFGLTNVTAFKTLPLQDRKAIIRLGESHGLKAHSIATTFDRTLLRIVEEGVDKAPPGRGSSQGSAPGQKEAVDRRSGQEEELADVPFNRDTELTGSGLDVFNPPTFFSQVERVIEQKMPNKASAEQIKGILSPNNGVKAEELEWLDIDSFLADNPKPTKAELLEYVRANNADVQEVEKVTGGGRPADQERDYRSRQRKIYERYEAGKISRAERDAEYEALDLLFPNTFDPTTEPKFSQYVLPGGENYKELLLTLPDKTFEHPVRVFDKATGRTVERFAGGLSAERYIRQNDPQFEALDYEDDGGKGEAYKSSHWDEPNVLAHIRFDERDGGKTLHVAEIQSDWHQEGRKKGYQDPKEQARRLAELRQQELVAREAFNKAEENFQRARQAERAAKDKAAAPVLKKYGVDSFAGLLTKPNAKIEYFRLVNSDPAVKAAADVSEAAHDVMKAAATPLTDIVGWIQEVAEPSRHVGNVPNAPFKKSWQELAFKRVLRYAVENGFERVTWDTGETQAERYDLSKQVKEIKWNPAAHPDHKIIHIKPIDGDKVHLEINDAGRVTNQLGPGDRGWEGKPLDEVVGKELADQILSGESGILAGLDLKVGGEGMRGFYDKMLPSFVNKYTKKWGSKVEATHISTGREWPFPIEIASDGNNFWLKGRDARTDNSQHVRLSENLPSYVAADDLREQFYNGQNEPVHSLDITPAMRESVMQGQPLFNQTNLFGDPTDVPASQIDLFDVSANEAATKAAKKEVLDTVLGKQTADYLVSLERSPDKNVSKAAKTILAKAERVSSEAQKQVIEEAANGLDLYARAKTTRTRLDDMFSQGWIDPNVKVSEEAKGYAREIESGNLQRVLDIMLNRSSQGAMFNKEPLFDKSEDVKLRREYKKVSLLTQKEVFDRARLTLNPENGAVEMNMAGLYVANNLITAMGQGGGFRGAYLNRFVAPKVLGTLKAAEQNARKRGLVSEAKNIRDIIKTFEESIDKYGDIVLAHVDPKYPVSSRSTLQEELGHRADAHTGVMDKTPFEGNIAYEKAAINLSDRYPERQIHGEILGKIQRDDAATELGIPEEDVDDLRAIRLQQLFDAGMTEAQFNATYGRISDTNRRSAETYGRLQSKRTPANESDASGDQRIIPSRSGEVRTGRDNESSPNLTETRTRPDISRLRQAELLSASRTGDEVNGNTSLQSDLPARRGTGGIEQYRPVQELTRPERRYIERRTKGNTDLARAIEDEVLFSKSADDKWTVGGVVLDVLASPKSIKTSFDLSGFRQAGILAIADPKIGVRAFIKNLKAFVPIYGAKFFDRFKQGLNIHPVIELAEASDLYLSSLRDQHSLVQREEAFMSRLLGNEKVFANRQLELIRKGISTPIRMSERAYVTMLDSVRIESFDKLSKELHNYNVRKGKPDDIEQYKALARAINYMTGRGGLGPIKQELAPLVNATIFSLRYWTSRLQLLNPGFYAGLPPGTRGIVMKQMAKFLAAVGIFGALAKLAGAEVDYDDTENPNNLKLKVGNWTWDIGFGLVQHIRYIGRMALAASNHDTSSMSYLTERYLRSKLSPTAGGLWNAIEGKNYIGEPTSLKEEAVDLVNPIMVANFADSAKAEGLPGIVKMAPEFFGISTTRYSDVAEIQKKIEKERAVPANTPAEIKERSRRIKAWQNLLRRARKYAAEDRRKASAGEVEQ